MVKSRKLVSYIASYIASYIVVWSPYSYITTQSDIAM